MMKLIIVCLLASCLFFSIVSTQSINVQKNVDGSFMLICNSTMSLWNFSYSEDDLSYEWYIDNDKQTYNDKFHRIKGNKLTVIKKHDRKSHYYKCVIEIKSIGAKFAISRNFGNDLDLKLYRNKRHKNEALKFTTKMMSNKNFELGSTGKIHCKASGSKNIFWKRNHDEELPKDVEDVNGTLIFNNVEINMKGIYTCIAVNDEKKITHQIEVKILPAFEVEPPKKLSVDELQNITIGCKGSGSPTIKWDYETKMIDAGDKFQIYENGSLFLKEVRSDDSGRYGCTIGNSAGFKRSETILTVKQGDLQKSNEEELDEGSNLLSNKAVLITCMLAIFYIICVIGLMIWCRQRRGAKQQNEIDPEHLKLNEDNDTHEDKASSNHKSVEKSLSSSFAFDIRFEKVIDVKKIGIDGNYKMEILTGFFNDSDLSSKIISKDNIVTDEIRMQQQTKVLIRTIKRDQEENVFSEFRRQIDLYCNVDCQNVVKLFGLSKDSKIFGMVLEHHDEFKTYLNDKTDVSFMELLRYSHQLACAVNAIHKAKLIHRDISLSNCVITKDSTIKLTSKGSIETSEYYEYNGYYLPLKQTAPEIISCCKNKSHINYTFATDIYAYGITMWEILHKGSQPFKALSKEDFFKKLQTNSLDYNSLVTSSSAEISDILLKCLKSDTCDRINSNDLVNFLEDAITKNLTS